MIKYKLPSNWIEYDIVAIANDLIEAKLAISTLRGMPYQRSWVEKLQELELRREIAGTSKIEGADFTEKELDAALSESANELFTRGQRQARAAQVAYRWIVALPDDKRIDEELIREIHRRVVTNADDDNCEPGVLRAEGYNVTFGQPEHRGVEGGSSCWQAFSLLVEAINGKFLEHDPIVQALAAHYHLAAMHPFGDGNGRTTRALEALLLQRADLRDFCFVSISNYYYDEKNRYLASLAEVRQKNHDLTEFLKFALKGIASQNKRVLSVIQTEVSKALFRNMMYDLFNRMKGKRQRVVRDRQVAILKILLEEGPMSLGDVFDRTFYLYGELKNSIKAIERDLNGLFDLKAVEWEEPEKADPRIVINLDWPTIITESEFFKKIKQMPRSKGTSPFK